MTIEFYWTPGGPFALRGLMTLAAKELVYHSRKLDLSKQENKTPSFFAISPTGMLPVLKDGNAIVRESQAIMFYLDRAYPSPPLYGTTPTEAGAIMQEICEQQSYADKMLAPLIASLLFNRPTPAGEAPQAAENIERLLGEVETRLSENGWLRTARLTAADINLYPPLRAVTRALLDEKANAMKLKAPNLRNFPNVSSWLERLAPLARADP